MDKNLFIGVDVGGTKVAAGLVNSEGEIVSHLRRPMVAHGSPYEGLQSVLDAISQLISNGSSQIQGIGICCPGPLDPCRGVILNPPNLPCWRNFALAESVRQVYPVPVRVDNDANGAALAEMRWGAAKGSSNVFYVTIGTGIGTGISLNGKIYHGRTGSAGEGGHFSIDYRGPICGCGKPGCIEILVSGPAIVGRARSRIAAGRTSSMLELAGGTLVDITGEIVAKAHATGDTLAAELLTEAAEMLALWLSNMIDLLDPEIVVIGGGASALYRPFFDCIRQRVLHLSVNPRAGEVPIAPARYGADAGIAGGAALCA